MHPNTTETNSNVDGAKSNNPVEIDSDVKSETAEANEMKDSPANTVQSVTENTNRNAHLNDAERRLVQLIETTANNDAEEQAIELVKSGQIREVNFYDSTFTTPLQHAAFRGRQRLARILLERGADVNDDRQTQGYTALMFGALSGRPDVCQVLLEYGARASYINRVGKTASQLAAFCGQHACAAAINNFVSRDVLEYYAIPQGLETEPMLAPATLVRPLHRLVIQTNVHPVHLLNTIMESSSAGDDDDDSVWPLLLVPNHAKRAVRVLNAMVEKQMKSGERMNECSALKFHYIASFLGHVQEQLLKRSTSDDGENYDNTKTAKQKITQLKKYFLKGSAPYGFCGTTDQFVCDLLRKFPYATQSPLLLQLVRQITQSLRKEHGAATTQQEQSTTSIALVHFLTTINGQRFFADDDDACVACGTLSPSNRKCSSCKMLAYCDSVCQKLHWFSHKKFCPTLLREREAMRKRAQKYEEEKKRAEVEKEMEEKKKQTKAAEAEQAAKELSKPDDDDVAADVGSQQVVLDINAPSEAAEAVDKAAAQAAAITEGQTFQKFGEGDKNTLAEVSIAAETEFDEKTPLITKDASPENIANEVAEHVAETLAGNFNDEHEALINPAML